MYLAAGIDHFFLSPRDKPYLHHVKQLGQSWPHLRTLADFMEIGTSPQRWKPDNPQAQSLDVSSIGASSTGKEANGDIHTLPDVEAKSSQRPEKPKPWLRLRNAIKKGKGNAPVPDAQLTRDDRARRTNVCKLDYLKDGGVHSTRYTSPETLRMEGLSRSDSDAATKFRLFVVEDLSRDVIEILGSHFQIDPSFFRAHILDYAWYNVRDPYRDPPNLNIVARHQPWVQFRFAMARYFSSSDEFQEGFKEAERFNVHRRPDDDANNYSFWDKEDAIIGVSRAKASFWVQEPTPAGEPGIGELPSPATVHLGTCLTRRSVVGILLLDPTIKAGKPLWCGSRNWETPAFDNTQYRRPATHRPELTHAENSFFDRFIYWAQKRDVFAKWETSQSPSGKGDSPWEDAQAPLQALLHLVCSEWLTVSDYIKARLNLIDWEIAYPQHFLRTGHRIDIALQKLHVWRRWVPLHREMLSETLEGVFDFSPRTASMDAQNLPVVKVSANKFNGLEAYRHDFSLVYAYMEEYQHRIDRLTSVATAFISIEDSRRGYGASKDVGRLTWLATIFIPLSFVATLLSMQSDVTELADSMRVWAMVAFPVIGVMLAIVFLSDNLHDWLRKKKQGMNNRR